MMITFEYFYSSWDSERSDGGMIHEWLRLSRSFLRMSLVHSPRGQCLKNEQIFVFAAASRKCRSNVFKAIIFQEFQFLFAAAKVLDNIASEINLNAISF